MWALCSFHWIVTEHESSRFSCLCLSQICSSTVGEAASSTRCASLQSWPCELSAVLLHRISPALVSVPIKRFLSPAFLFRYARVSGLTIGFCPINSDNNDSPCVFDWTVPECGSSEFSRAASANLAVLSQSQTMAVCFPSASTSRDKRAWILHCQFQPNTTI